MTNALGPIAASLLAIEGALGALWVAGRLPLIASTDPGPLVVILVRAVAGALQLTGAWLLFERRDAAVPIARIAILASAAVTTVGIGLRVAPTNLDPALRWYFVGAYWAYALALLWVVRRVGRSAAGMR
jgi:hypothetical protein